MIGEFLRFFRKKMVGLFQSRVVQVLDYLPGGGAITLLDIGAAGEIEPRWKPFARKLKYLGFEPDARSREILNNKEHDFLEYKIFPYAVADTEKEIPFHLCQKPQVSSIFEPNMNFLKNFPDSNRFDIVRQETMSVVPIDNLDIDDADFIKIDIQGAELLALEGSDRLLDEVLGVELEVEFIDLYKSQPLFGDICAHLSEKGFEFIDFVNLARWEREEHNGFGQCIFGDGLFIRTPENLDFSKLSIDKISAYFSMLVIYRRYDLIEASLGLIPKDMASDFSAFRDNLNKARSVNSFVQLVSKSFNFIMSLFGSNYRVHLIY